MNLSKLSQNQLKFPQIWTKSQKWVFSIEHRERRSSVNNQVTTKDRVHPLQVLFICKERRCPRNQPSPWAASSSLPRYWSNTMSLKITVTSPSTSPMGACNQIYVSPLSAPATRSVQKYPTCLTRLATRSKLIGYFFKKIVEFTGRLPNPLNVVGIRVGYGSGFGIIGYPRIRQFFFNWKNLDS